MPPKGQKLSEETKQKLRAINREKLHPMFVKRGITREMLAEAEAKGERWCSGPCKAFRPKDYFYPTQRLCRKCNLSVCSENRRQRNKEQREAQAEYHRALRRGEKPEWPKKIRKRADTSANQRRARYRRKYGVTPEWYDEKLIEQKGGCALCGDTKPPLGNDYFYVDHDHSTGKARGLLCLMCNHAIERVEADPHWGVRALAYLDRYAALDLSAKSVHN
jgi:Recombination endonuclease VII